MDIKKTCEQNHRSRSFSSWLPWRSWKHPDLHWYPMFTDLSTKRSHLHHPPSSTAKSLFQFWKVTFFLLSQRSNAVHICGKRSTSARGWVRHDAKAPSNQVANFGSRNTTATRGGDHRITILFADYYEAKSRRLNQLHGILQSLQEIVS